MEIDEINQEAINLDELLGKGEIKKEEIDRQIQEMEKEPQRIFYKHENLDEIEKSVESEEEDPTWGGPVIQKPKKELERIMFWFSDKLKVEDHEFEALRRLFRYKGVGTFLIYKREICDSFSKIYKRKPEEKIPIAVLGDQDILSEQEIYNFLNEKDNEAIYVLLKYENPRQFLREFNRYYQKTGIEIRVKSIREERRCEGNFEEENKKIREEIELIGDKSIIDLDKTKKKPKKDFVEEILNENVSEIEDIFGDKKSKSDSDRVNYI
ncbi:MAG: hypothetical protein IB618_00920 [Candidatus Pacearchaeota archaeon]|nr:MAG: hypothetical protein IB618_00920 [Candidatus Pacearchaeota archaeon]